MNNSLLAEIMLKIESFPSLPKTGVKILELLGESKSSITEIEKVFSYDPGLTANFLKLANSAYFGIPSKISSVKQAIVLLGTNRLKEIILATSASKLLGEKLPGYDLKAGDLWRHSIAVSNAAVALAKFKKLSEPNNIFTYGLLHDIGKLVLGEFVKNQFKCINQLISNGVSLIVAENMVLGTDHAEIGAQILSQWRFPHDVVNAIRFHHNPDMLHIKDVHIDLLYLSNLICKINGAKYDKVTISKSIYPSLKERLGISQNILELISNRIAGWVNDVSAKLIFD